MPDEPALVYDLNVADLVADGIRAGVESVLKRGLAQLGLEPVFEDSFVALVVRVSSIRQTGTAYIELRFDDVRMRSAQT